MGAVEAFDAGFTAQVSVMPPSGRPAPTSKISEDDAGKVPALLGYDGRYHGYNWLNSRPARDSVAEWLAKGSSIGFLASEYPAIDIDIMNEEISEAIVQAVTEQMGPCLIRTGQYPKRLMIFRSEEPLRSFDMRYTRWSDLLAAEDLHLVQFLARGRQYVMFGTHPVTMQPYTITDPGSAMILGPVSLPALTAERVKDLFDIITEVMARYGYETKNNAAARVLGSEVDQEELKAPSMSDLADLVARLPNTYPSRHECITIGHAIKAAGADDPANAFELYMDWCQRWQDGSNPPEWVAHEWSKFTSPFHVGWDYLLHQAEVLKVDIGDFRFGPAAPQPTGGAPEPFTAEPSPEVKASQEARAAAAADEDGILSDRWLAQEFMHLHASDFLIPAGMDSKHCLQWDGRHWRTVPRGALSARVSNFLASCYSTARRNFENAEKQAQAIMRLGSYKAITNVTSMVASDPAIIREMDQFDSDPDIINTPSGPVHLPTGELLKPNKDLLLTKCTAVSPDPQGYCPTWERVVREWTRGDSRLAFFIQCLSGYALTGHSSEQIFPFFIGTGGNGKSKYLSTITEIMGPYAVGLPVELFQRGHTYSNPEYHLANMHGARLVTTTETVEGGKWDEARIKQLTGEDTIQARVPFGLPFTFRSSSTIIVIGNHAPELEGVTEAMQRRVRVVPWDFTPEQADKKLEEKLRAELPGILTWCIEGAKAWYTHGMPEAPSIVEYTMGYFAEQDTTGMWVRDVVTVTGDHNSDFITSKELYDNFAAWCRVNDVTPLHRTTFHRRITTQLRKMGLRKSRSSVIRGWSGAKLKQVDATPPNVVQFPAVAPPRPGGVE